MSLFQRYSRHCNMVTGWIILCFLYFKCIGAGESVLSMSTCTSEVYCQSGMLDTIQMAHLYPDSKTFVDKPLRSSEADTLVAYKALPVSPSKEDLKKFISDYFSEEGHELEEWTPVDFNDRPENISSIHNPELRDFATDLNEKWKVLGRKMKTEVSLHPDRYSLIDVPQPFIVPGGRFRELYYWDSYWVVKGLLICDMKATVKGMLINLLSMVDRFGFVPNGGRKYYLNRSQPPLMLPMIAEYLKYTDDVEFVRDYIHLMDKEYKYWIDNHQVNVSPGNTSYSVFRYIVNTSFPRPESYREDKILAQSKTAELRPRFYADIASAAESGWDFSSRWADLSKPIKELSSISTQDVIPVDLNSFLCWNARILSSLHKKLGNGEKETYYRSEFVRIKILIEDLFWDESDGTWYDYNLVMGNHNNRFYASMVAPLFTDSVYGDATELQRKVGKVLNYIEQTLPDLSKYAAGVPTSLVESGEQWDYPNAWPPLQHMWIYSFNKQADTRSQSFARELATRWVRNTWNKWKVNGDMFEKYNAITGSAGEGGEYEVQAGFGWTNGVILDLLSTYPDMSTADGSLTTLEQTTPNTSVRLDSPTTLLLLIALLLAVLWL